MFLAPDAQSSQRISKTCRLNFREPGHSPIMPCEISGRWTAKPPFGAPSDWWRGMAGSGGEGEGQAL